MSTEDKQDIIAEAYIKDDFRDDAPFWRLGLVRKADLGPTQISMEALIGSSFEFYTLCECSIYANRAMYVVMDYLTTKLSFTANLISADLIEIQEEQALCKLVFDLH